MDRPMIVVWSAALGVLAVGVGYSFAPDRSAPFKYEEVKLRPSEVSSGAKADLCVRGLWTEVPDSGETKLATLCGDGRPLATEFYPLDLSGPQKGAMAVDKCAEGGRPRPFEIKCKAPGPFVITAEQTFKRRTWWGWRYETTHPAYTIRGTVLPP